jgi:hypothetical protein
VIPETQFPDVEPPSQADLFPESQEQAPKAAAVPVPPVATPPKKGAKKQTPKEREKETSPQEAPAQVKPKPKPKPRALDTIAK